MTGYTGRFAPSPTGPLHAGSMVAALASWLDARAHGGRWLVRIEDVDTPRTVPGATDTILAQLAVCGLISDAEPMRQSTRGAAYQAALDNLVGRGLAYPCGCTRSDIVAALAAAGRVPARHEELAYPGTCRHGVTPGRAARAWRLELPDFERNDRIAQVIRSSDAIDSIASDGNAGGVRWTDRRLGPQTQDVSREVGDFVLKRADGLWAYQLAVVVDDAAQHVSHVVRGADLASNTARQILLQRALGLPTPSYLHVPLVLGTDGEKLSKQNGAIAVNQREPLRTLRAASNVLGIPVDGVFETPAAFLASAVRSWRARWLPSTTVPPIAPSSRS